MSSKAAVAALWVRLGEVYGLRWRNAYGATPLETWRRGLADLSPEQLGEGVRACIESGNAFPPTLPEFRALCLRRQAHYEPWMAAPKALTYQPSKVTAPGDARAHLAALKRRLGRG